MMISIDWPLFALGLIGGALAGALFFGGLAWGMRLALRTERPMAVLLPSAAIRIALLLAAGMWVAGQGAVALAGFAIAFLVLRLVMLTVLRAGPSKTKPSKGAAQWN